MSQPTWTSKLLTDCAHRRVQSVLPFSSHRTAGISTLFSLYIAISLFLSGCCTNAEIQSYESIYAAQTNDFRFAAAHIPAFQIKSDSQPYNKIGTPKVTEKNGKPLVVVSSSSPTLYFEQSSFTTQKNRYTNLIYRIHFSKVPFDICNLNITTGNNPGLLVIYTLDDANSLVLITTVHTCGCYLAFFPTTNLPKEAYPDHWPLDAQSVYGYTLPSKLVPPLHTTDQPYYFTLENGSHRISNVAHPPNSHNMRSFQPMEVHPMESLYHLPYKDMTVSFFEEAGQREGYVKNNTKILEKLLISWWAFDWHVGEDKAYGKSDSSRTPFYTSLKFWQRNSSDMKNFPQFLSYWGWDL
ncbi:MAG: hypothetical protein ACI8ZB_000347 [Desulforhopalus sp.]|jgi:hypothetical protein